MSLEAQRSFACFGGTATVHVGGAGRSRSADEAASRAEAYLLDAHARLSRFLPESELCRLNLDPRERVPVSSLLLELAAAVRRAGLLSGGLVDATLLDEIERAGYRESYAGTGPHTLATEDVVDEQSRAPAAASPRRSWSKILVNRRTGTVSRPAGVQIDGGGIAKGLLADLVATSLRDHPTFAVDCCGDIRIGGTSRKARVVLVDDPNDGEPLHSLEIAVGAVATSGIAKRSWLGADGSLVHHLLDPSSGAPAFTGLAQVTALAPTAFLAEVFAKQALLSGPESAPRLLPFGGVLVLDDRSVQVVGPSRAKAKVALVR